MDAESLQHYRLLNEQENYRDRMRMARNYDSKDVHAIFQRLFRKARNKLIIFKNENKQIGG